MLTKYQEELLRRCQDDPRRQWGVFIGQRQIKTARVLADAGYGRLIASESRTTARFFLKEDDPLTQ